jgi:putative ABC transport system substrate-binding protein
MDRRAFLTSGLALIATPRAADAQTPTRIPRLGVLVPEAPRTTPNRAVEALRQGLRELGYVDGHTILIELRWAAGEIDREPALISDLVRLPVDLIVVPTTSAALSAKAMTATIPIVSASAGALVESGAIVSLARPGGNITGLTGMVPELSAKRLELLKEVVPTLSRVAALASPYRPSSLGEIYIKQTEAAARVVGVELTLLHVERPADLDAAFDTARRWRAGAVTILSNPFFSVHAARVGEVVLRNRLPCATGDPGVVEAGALVRYAVSIPDMWRQAASYVDRVLKGTKPADLPVAQPTKFELVVNSASRES